MNKQTRTKKPVAYFLLNNSENISEVTETGVECRGPMLAVV